jgi:hypothetical protein
MDIKKVWTAPELIIYGNLKTITTATLPPIPPKEYGGADGATYKGLNVTWGV